MIHGYNGNRGYHRVMFQFVCFCSTSKGHISPAHDPSHLDKNGQWRSCQLHVMPRGRRFQLVDVTFPRL